MNFEALESFRVFAKILNFTRTAEMRHLTQPALHKQIKTLSESLGVELYRRQGRSLKLTEAGITVARFSRELGERMDLLREALHCSDANLKVSLAAGRGSYLYLLGEAISSFHANHGDRLKVLTTNQAETLSAVRSGEAHLGVTVLEERPSDLKTILLRSVTPHLIVSNNHPLASRKSIRMRTLDGVALICPEPPSPMRHMIAHRLLAEGLHFNPVIDTNGWELMMHFANLGLGAAIVNGCCRPPSGTVAVRLVDLPKVNYYLVSHPDEYPIPEVEELRSYILNFGKNAELFS